MRVYSLVAVLGLVWMGGCPAPAPAPPPKQEEDVLSKAKRYLVGRYDSSAQAASDKEFFAIQLAMCEVESSLGPHALYVEQAAMESPREPYRQRLYLLSPGPAAGQVLSTIYEFNDPKAVIGLCDAPRPVPGDAVSLRAGCEVLLSWSGDHFTGQTGPKSCPSSLRGASYATTEVTLYEDRLLSWDRGFDSSDKQVWGAVKGGYLFQKR